MAYNILGHSGSSTSLSWSFGDTNLFRFVLQVSPDRYLPAGVKVDWVLRTPQGVVVFEEPKKEITYPVGGLPYFEVFVSPKRAFRTPPGNYIYSLTFSRPYGQDGNYRYTPLSGGSVSVSGNNTITPDNLLDLQGDTPAQDPTIIYIDASKISLLQATGTPPEPPTPSNPPTFGTQPQSSVTVPANGSTTLTCLATGEGTISYQWYKNTVNSVNNALILPNEKSDTLQLTNTNSNTLNQVTYYFVKATDSTTALTVNSNISTVTFTGVPAYQAPSVTLTSDATGTHYTGSTISAIAFSATVTKHTDTLTGDVVFKKGSTPASVTDIIGAVPVNPNGGIATFNYNAPVTDTTSFTATVTDGTSNAISTVHTVTFTAPPIPDPVIYWGISPAATVTDVTAFESQESGKVSPFFFMLDGQGYAFIAYPASWGNVKNIKDANNFAVQSGFTKSEVTVDTVTYNLYMAKVTATYFDGESEYQVNFN